MQKNLMVHDSVVIKEMLEILVKLLNTRIVEKSEILTILKEFDMPEDVIINFLGERVFQIRPVPDFSKMMIDFRKLLYTPLPITRSDCFRKISSSKQTSLKSKRRLSCGEVHFNRRMMNSRR